MPPTGVRGVHAAHAAPAKQTGVISLAATHTGAATRYTSLHDSKHESRQAVRSLIITLQPRVSRCPLPSRNHQPLLSRRAAGANAGAMQGFARNNILRAAGDTVCPVLPQQAGCRKTVERGVPLACLALAWQTLAATSPQWHEQASSLPTAAGAFAHARIGPPT